MSDNEKKIELDEETSELFLEKMELLGTILEALVNAWFPSILDLDLERTLKGLVIWQTITADLEELVGIIHNQFGDGRSLEEALEEQANNLEAEAEEFEKFFERLEGLRENAENN